VAALSKWGMRLLGPRSEDEAFRPHWLVIGLRGVLRADRAADVTLEVDFDLRNSERVRVRIDHGTLTHVPDPERDPDVVVRGDLATLAAIADGSLPSRTAIRDRRLRVEGSRDAIREYGRLFRAS
jgi:hypothetical protein